MAPKPQEKLTGYVWYYHDDTIQEQIESNTIRAFRPIAALFPQTSKRGQMPRGITESFFVAKVGDAQKSKEPRIGGSLGDVGVRGGNLGSKWSCLRR